MAQSFSTMKCALWLCSCLVLLVAGCGERDNSSERAGGAQDAPRSLRIASLSPAMTTMAIDLGLGDELVGCTPFCRGLESPVAVVGSLEGVDAEVLVRVEPTVVLIQPGAGGLDPALVELGQRRGFAIVEQRLDTLADVEAAIRAIAAACESSDQMRDVEGLCSRINLLRNAPEAQGPRSVLLYSVEPLGAAGGGTYLDEILTAAGGDNALSNEGWVELSAEELIAIDPEVIVVFGVRSPAGLAELPWQHAPRILLIDSPDAMEPSSRAPAVARQLREALRDDES